MEMLLLDDHIHPAFTERSDSVFPEHPHLHLWHHGTLKHSAIIFGALAAPWRLLLQILELLRKKCLLSHNVVIVVKGIMMVQIHQGAMARDTLFIGEVNDTNKTFVNEPPSCLFKPITFIH